MDLDSVKENIQPLASGRNILRLEAALSAETQQEAQEAMLMQRYEYENAIRNYSGDDPLSVWYDYVMWVEQSYPKSGKESALDDLIQKCLLEFENDVRYKQDPRMIKLYIKYIDSQPNQQEHFNTLYNQGVGTMVADLYICWAYYYDTANNFERANAVYQMGLDARAEPIEQLQQAHQQFGFSMSQRLLNQDDAFKADFRTSMEERRSALTSLRSHRHKHVGSIRTGEAVKSLRPGRVHQHATNASYNAKVSVFEENHTPEFRAPNTVDIPPTATSIMQSIMDSSKKQENIREPGPWSNAKRSSIATATNRVFGDTATNCTLAFPIMVDMDESQIALSPIPLPVDMHAKGIQLPTNFHAKNLPFPDDFNVPHFVEEDIPSNHYARYDKIMLFPKPDKSFSSEELAAYKWLKKRKIVNSLTVAQDKVWQNTYEVGIRLPPQFSARNEPQEQLSVKRCIEDEANARSNGKFNFRFSEIYPNGDCNEYSNEELLRQKWREGKMQSQLRESATGSCAAEESMDETMVVTGRQSIYRGAVRKSIVPGGRKSIMPMAADDVGDFKRRSMFPSMKRSECKMENEPKAKYEETPKHALSIFETTESCASDVKREAETPQRHVSHEETTPSCNTLNPSISKPEFKTPVLTAAGFVKIAGVTRKSICPSRRDNGTQIPSSVATPAIRDETKSTTNQSEDEFKSLAPSTFEKTPGVTRKSTYPIKRDMAVHFPEVLLCPSKSAPVIAAENEKIAPVLPLAPFTIFEDDNPQVNASPEKAVADEAVVFKTPHHIAVPRKSLAAATVHYDELDETSTQQFNFFINTQSVSTPKSSSRAKVAFQPIDPSALAEKFEPASVASTGVPASSTSGTGSSAVSPDCITVRPAQLSTILETTETNTLSSATASTKSSVDTQYTSSPETLNELMTDRSQRLTTFKTIQSDVTGCVGAVADDRTSNYEEQAPHVSSNFAVDGQLNPHYEPMLQANHIHNVEGHNEVELQHSKVADQSNSVSRARNTTIPAFPLYEDRTETLLLPPINFIKPLTEPILSVHKDMTIPSISLLDESTQSGPFMNFTKSTVPNMPKEICTADVSNKQIETICPISIYEDHTETVPIVNHLPKVSVDNTVQLPAVDVVLPTMSPIKIYEDRDETLATLNLPKKDTPTASTDHCMRVDKKEAHPRKSTIENYQLHTVDPPRPAVSTNQPKQPFGILMSAARTIAKPSESFFKTEEDELLEIFQQTPVKQRSLQQIKQPTTSKPLMKLSPPKQSHIPVPKSLLRPTKNYEIVSFAASNTTARPVLEPMAQQMNVTRPTSPRSPNSQTRTNDIESSKNIPILPTSNRPAVTAAVSRSSAMDCLAIQQQSLHIKDEQLSCDFVTPCASLSTNDKHMSSVYLNESEPLTIDSTILHENSIYVQRNSSKNNARESDSSEESTHDANEGEISICSGTYEHRTVNLNETKQFIEDHIYANSNPFDVMVQRAFLEQVELTSYIQRELDSSQMVNVLRPLRPRTMVTVNDCKYNVLALIGKGAYGTVFSAKCVKTGEMYAMKQERPANLWEYYICLEIQSRIENVSILPAFMNIKCSLVANNASLLVTELAPHGSMLHVCNVFKSKMNKNLPPCVVMMLANQMLSVVDHLHACKIIHADIKPDNWLLMRRLDIDPNFICLKLVDYGQSIDLQQYPDGQRFYAKLKTKNFVCTEMLDNRPWTYQTDLFCLASTVHALLFGRYMEVVKKKITSGYQITTNIPRYFSKTMWSTFFDTLINVPDCKSMPNLQLLRSLLLNDIIDDKNAQIDVRAFNEAIGAIA